MTRRVKEYKVKELFKIQTGDFHAVKELEEGNTPLISCGDTANGLIGYFDIPADKLHKRKLTVAYNGSWPLMVKFHPYEFGVKDDVAVLNPLTPMSDGTLLYIAASLDRMVWRYHYGRKCYREKLGETTVTLPVVKQKGNGDALDESYMDGLLKTALEKVTKDVTSSVKNLI
jgi:type I restriction enzyme M protein